MATIIGLDLGTTTVSGVLFDAERDHVLRSIRHDNDAAIGSRRPTRAEQDPGSLRALALGVLAELASSDDQHAGRGQPVEGIALTGQKHGLLCIDNHGEPLTPLISWQDQRTSEPLAPAARPGQAERRAGTTLDRLQDRLQDLDWRENGCRIGHGYGAATLFWLVERDQVPSQTRWVCSPASWLACQLSGQPPVMDPTHAASWGIYGLVDGAWNAAFLERLGFKAGLFPPVRPPGERVGGLSPELARQAGLPAGTPVFNALGDTQAAFVGAVTLVPETRELSPEQVLLLNLGTGGQICWATPRFELPTAQVETRPLPPSRFLRVGASLCGGAAYAWLNRTVRAWLREFGVEAGQEAVYERLNALAQACGEMAGLRVRTTFLGVRGDPVGDAGQPSHGGAIEGITLDNLELGRLARATLTGMVDELYGLYESTGGGTEPGSNIDLRWVLATGGAVHKTPLLRTLIAERLGLPVHQPSQSEVAALGAAQMASGSMGV